jgi:thioredoxin 1
MSTVLTVNTENFKSEVKDYQGCVLVDFWAPWCAPCRMMSPIMDDIAKIYDGKLKVVKINVDENTEIATLYKVRGIPAFAMIKNGELVDSHVGASTKPVFQMFIERTLGENPI